MGIEDAGRWVPLTYYLRLKRGQHPAVEVTFRQIEAVLGDALPKPARKQPEWWRNDAATPQGHAWLDAGWTVSAVDLSNERVTFVPSGA